MVARAAREDVIQVQYHGPSGEFEGTWPDETELADTAILKGIAYRFAGKMDGTLHFREVRDG